MKNALSVDVEDYFMVENFASRIRFEDWPKYPLRVDKGVDALLELFETKQVKSTFFTLGWVAEKKPEVVKKIAKAGHEIACHGYSHRPVFVLGRERFAQEISQAKKILEEVSGQKIIGYRAATYSLNEKTPWAWEILASLGFRYDSSIRPAFRFSPLRNAMNRIHSVQAGHDGELIEFPISVAKVLGWTIPFCAGGYFRLFPFSWIVRGIHKLNRLGLPANVTLHPWEVDPAQPRLPCSPLASFRHYLHLSKTLEKLERLLNRFTFAPLREVLAL